MKQKKNEINEKNMTLERDPAFTYQALKRKKKFKISSP